MWILTPVRQAKTQIKKILGAISISGDNFIDADGNIITGLASYTWAQFIAGGFDLTVARHVVVTDTHSSISGYGGSLWYIDPSAPVGSKRVCRSGGIVTTWAARPTVSDFNGLDILLSDYNYARYRSDGSNYKPVGRALLFNGIFGTFASPTLSVNLTNSAQLFSWATQPKIPAGMGITNSKFTVEAHIYRNVNTSTYAPVLNMYFGRGGNTSDPVIWAETMSNAASASGYPKPQLSLRSQQSILSSYTGAYGGGKLTASSAVERNGTPSTLDFAYDQFLSLQLAATATTPSPAETISIQTLQIWQDI